MVIIKERHRYEERKEERQKKGEKKEKYRENLKLETATISYSPENDCQQFVRLLVCFVKNIGTISYKQLVHNC